MHYVRSGCALCLHLQLHLSHLESAAFHTQQHLSCSELGAGSGKAGVLIELRGLATSISLISALLRSPIP